jgi:hypothetical protein
MNKETGALDRLNDARHLAESTSPDHFPACNRGADCLCWRCLLRATLDAIDRLRAENETLAAMVHDLREESEAYRRGGDEVRRALFPLLATALKHLREHNMEYDHITPDAFLKRIAEVLAQEKIPVA